MAGKDEKVNPYIIKGFKNKKMPPSEFPVTDPAALKGIRDSIKGADKGRAEQARFQAWGKGIDYDAVKNQETPDGDV